MDSDPTLNQLGPVIGVTPEADKTGGIWRFDETKANALKTKTDEKASAENSITSKPSLNQGVPDKNAPAAEAIAGDL